LWFLIVAVIHAMKLTNASILLYIVDTWGMVMQLNIKKWGNSASVRIPAALMEAAGLKVDETIDMREENGRLIIEPIKRPVYKLEDLLAGLTEDNLHEEVDWGPPVGKEFW
jgi:antitoxin MazE